MKTLSLLILIVSTSFVPNIKKSMITARYNCHVIAEKKGRCTGSANCSACRNCSRCAYCSNGGSCGVCGGGSSSSSNYYYSSPRKTKSSSSASSFYSISKVSRTYTEDEAIIIYNEMINLRKGPSLDYEIIEKLYLGDTVTFIEKNGEWIKVKVENTGSIGYVYSKLLK